MSDCANPSDLILRARQGETRVLNRLIDDYRPYLRLLARLRRDPRLTAKLDDSDMVQEASALAARNFADFRGNTEGEFTAWLRTTMARVTAQALRHYTRQRRNVHLEQDLQRSYDESSSMMAAMATSTDEPSPSEQVMRRERDVLVAEALHELPPHYREVIILREYDGLTLEEIGRRMGRSADSVRKTWARAILKVRKALEGRV